jgi:hypothetical protein
MYNGPARAMIFAQGPPEFPPETPRRSQLPAAASGRPQAAGGRRQASPDSRLRTPEISSDHTMTDDDEQISTASDGHSGGHDNDDEVVVMPALPVAPVARSSRKRAKRDFPWSYTRAWAEGDAPQECGKRQCNSCKGWYSADKNASGWKSHLSKQHGITNSNMGSSGKGSMVQSGLAFARPVFSDVVLRKFETAVVDYVIGGGVSLRALAAFASSVSSRR